jgi:hypothetical protein
VYNKLSEEQKALRIRIMIVSYDLRRNKSKVETGRAIAQAGGRWLPTAATLVQTRV